MPQRHTPAYPVEFRERLVELVRSGRSPEELSKEFEPSAQTIRNWVAQADRDAGTRSDGLTTAEREELRRLRRENKKLKVEREILKKAALGSIGQCNAARKSFCGGFEAQSSSRPLIESASHRVEISLRETGEVHSFGKVLPQ